VSSLVVDDESEALVSASAMAGIENAFLLAEANTRQNSRRLSALATTSAREITPSRSSNSFSTLSTFGNFH
jgi:hypothetical protein